MLAQIGGYLSEDEHKAFKKYVASLDVSESSLANLLILRELHRKRLPELFSKLASHVPSDQRRRVTAHQRRSEPKAAFETWCNEVGISPGQAASILFRAELNECWLRRCIGR